MRSQFESHWRWNSTCDSMVLRCTEPFIVTFPLSQYDLNNTERDVKHQISRPRWLSLMGVRLVIRIFNGFDPRLVRQHSFIEIDHEIFSTVILSLPLILEGQLTVSGKKNVHNTG